VSEEADQQSSYNAIDDAAFTTTNLPRLVPLGMHPTSPCRCGRHEYAIVSA